MSKRLSSLGIECPRYTKKDKVDPTVGAVAIDSTWLKHFGRDEWHQEKYKVSAKNCIKFLFTQLLTSKPPRLLTTT
ncbi:hypothetical protein [Francisella sp. SYW-2]|uniref:hypothetical protein n=1 Tax=Francisella sp. SYW-2 TaxID=2610886 RepID=UPI00123D44EB|nr:hypothetical protein [Francisella sp. SYW-2]